MEQTRSHLLLPPFLHKKRTCTYQMHVLFISGFCQSHMCSLVASFHSASMSLMAFSQPSLSRLFRFSFPSHFLIFRFFLLAAFVTAIDSVIKRRSKRVSADRTDPYSVLWGTSFVEVYKIAWVFFTFFCVISSAARSNIFCCFSSSTARAVALLSAGQGVKLSACQARIRVTQMPGCACFCPGAIRGIIRLILFALTGFAQLRLNRAFADFATNGTGQQPEGRVSVFLTLAAIIFAPLRLVHTVFTTIDHPPLWDRFAANRTNSGRQNIAHPLTSIQTRRQRGCAADPCT